jgi:hypothetical protein
LEVIKQRRQEWKDLEFDLENLNVPEDEEDIDRYLLGQDDKSPNKG